MTKALVATGLLVSLVALAGNAGASPLKDSELVLTTVQMGSVCAIRCPRGTKARCVKRKKNSCVLYRCMR